VDTPRDGGKPTYSNCKGILIYKKQKNGDWLIFRDIWNDNK
jgi:ketosteroid isomerase-like protein